MIFCIYSNPVGCYDISRNEPRRESLEILMLQTLANMPLVFVIFLYSYVRILKRQYVLQSKYAHVFNYGFTLCKKYETEFIQ